jgi:hypothetical protein
MQKRRHTDREKADINARIKLSRSQNLEKFQKRDREGWQRLRTKVIMAYGGKCACCGETELKFLTIDHINNDGHIERKNASLQTIFRRLRDRGYPDTYQVLCYNCNCAKGFYGICPHQAVKQKQAQMSFKIDIKIDV